VLADYYFEQTAWNGEQVNTFQVFTYNIYNKDGEGFIDKLGNYVKNESDIVLFNTGTIELAGGTYGPSSPEIFSIKSDTLFIRASDVIIKEDIHVENGYILYIEAWNSIQQLPSASVDSTVIMQIRDFLGLGDMHMMTDNEIKSYCTKPNGGYKAREYVERPGQKLEVIPEDPKIPEETNQLNLYIFPNPARNMFRVKIESVELRQYSFQLINISGKVVINEIVSGANNPVFEIDVSALPSAIYILVVTDELGRVARKKISIIN
jgi:Secretion system C-terminal sorting domain